jgi:hypothetical protein
LVTVLSQVRLGVGADVIVVVGFVELGDQPYRVVEHRHDMRERIAEEPGDPHRHVDAGPAQLGHRNGSQINDSSRGVVPNRPNTEQRKHFGDVVAGRAHRRGTPHRQADRARPAPVVVAVARQQRIRHGHTGFPGQPRRHRLGIYGIEVAPGGQDIYQAAQRRARRSRRDEPAVQSP